MYFRYPEGSTYEIEILKEFMKIERLKRSQEISAVFSENNRVPSSIGLILWKKNREQVSRVAYCVSKKHGNAVMRNHIKRIMRQLIHESEAVLPNGYDLVILPSLKQKEWKVSMCKKPFSKLIEKLIQQIS